MLNTQSEATVAKGFSPSNAVKGHGMTSPTSGRSCSPTPRVYLKAKNMNTFGDPRQLHNLNLDYADLKASLPISPESEEA